MMADDPENSDDGANRPRDAGNSTRGFVIADADLAARLKLTLKVFEIPSVAHAREDGRGILVVPTQYGSTAAQVLSATPGIVLEPGPEAHFRRHDPARDTVLFEHPVLKLSPAEIRQRGADALEELFQCAVRGAQPVLERAILLLGRCGSDAHPTLDRLVVLGAQSGNSPFVGLLVREGKVCVGRGAQSIPESLRPLCELLHHEDANVRQIAVRVLGAIKVTQAIPLLADALLDESPDVAIEADDAFLNWDAEDEGFEPDLELDERRAIAERRKSFVPPQN